MAVRKINESTLTAIGNAIRAKTGGSALINPEDMATEIGSIQTGGGLPPIQHFQYIQPETKDYTTGGFASYFIQTYLNKGDGLYFGFVNDITESTNQYKAVSFICPIMTLIGVGSASYKSLWHRPINWVASDYKDSSAVSSISFYLYEGAIIDIFFIPFSEF